MNTDQTAPTCQGVKICRVCKLSQPITEFRRRLKDSEIRMHQCRNCRKVSDQNRRERRQHDADRRQIQKSAIEIAKTDNPRRSEVILNRLVDAMGGPEDFVKRWSEECHRLSRNGRYSARMIRMYEMLVKLMIHAGGQ